jgi:hypothetical protein
MKTTILPLAIALAFSFTAVPADAALSNADKCNVFRAKTEMNFSKCMKIANLLEAKGKTPDRAKCVTKYDDGIAKAKTKFVNDKLGVTEAECGLEQASTDKAKALDVLAAGQEIVTGGQDAGTILACTDPLDLEASTRVIRTVAGVFTDAEGAPMPASLATAAVIVSSTLNGVNITGFTNSWQKVTSANYVLTAVSLFLSDADEGTECRLEVYNQDDAPESPNPWSKFSTAPIAQSSLVYLSDGGSEAVEVAFPINDLLAPNTDYYVWLKCDGGSPRILKGIGDTSGGAGNNFGSLNHIVYGVEF